MPHSALSFQILDALYRQGCQIGLGNLGSSHCRPLTCVNASMGSRSLVRLQPASAILMKQLRVALAAW